MKIHLLDTDPRQVTDAANYATNHGSFAEVMINLNNALKEIGCYAEPDDADFVGIAEAIQVGFKYKDKKSFVIHVWETSNALPYVISQEAYKTQQRIFGLSNQITNLWHKAGVSNVKTVYGGCDTDFWKPTTPKFTDFTFFHVNSSTIRSGLDLTINAFCMAFKGREDIRLIIKDTNETEKLNQKIEEARRFCPNITYINERTSSLLLRDLYSSSHVCLNLLRATSFGMPLLECSACGCLCVTGDVPPTNELIRPEYGVLLKPLKEISIFAAAPTLEQEWGLRNWYPHFAYPEPPRFYTYDVEEYAKLLLNLYNNWFQYSIMDTRTPIVNNWQWKKSAEKLVEYLNEV